MLSWPLSLRSSISTSRKSSVVKAWHLSNWCKCTERSSRWLKIFMTCAAEEPKIIKKRLLTYKITIWRRSLQENALCQIEVVILSWTHVISTFYTTARWILNCTTMLTHFFMNIELESFLTDTPSIRSWTKKRWKKQKKEMVWMPVLCS